MTDRRIADVVFYGSVAVTIAALVIDLVVRSWHSAALMAALAVGTTTIRQLARTHIAWIEIQMGKTRSEADVAANIAEKVRAAQFGGVSVDMGPSGPTH